MNLPRHPVASQRRSRSRIFLFRNGQRLGPYYREEISRQLAQGEIALEDLVWHSRLDRWMPVRELPKASSQGEERFEMPPLPEGVIEEAPPKRRRMKAPEVRLPQAEAPPVEKVGWWQRWFGGNTSGRKEAGGDSRDPLALKRLLNGRLEGVQVVGGQTLVLHATTVRGRRVTVKLAGALKVELTGFSLANPVRTLHLYRESTVPENILQRFGMSREEITRHFQFGREGWTLLYLGGGSEGCELFALLDPAATAPTDESGDDLWADD